MVSESQRLLNRTIFYLLADGTFIGREYTYVKKTRNKLAEQIKPLVNLPPQVYRLPKGSAHHARSTVCQSNNNPTGTATNLSSRIPACAIFRTDSVLPETTNLCNADQTEDALTWTIEDLLNPNEFTKANEEFVLQPPLPDLVNVLQSQTESSSDQVSVSDCFRNTTEIPENWLEESEDVTTNNLPSNQASTQRDISDEITQDDEDDIIHVLESPQNVNPSDDEWDCEANLPSDLFSQN